MNPQQPQQTSTQSLSLKEVRQMMRDFVDEREWHSFHTPRNLLLALVGEVGEVAEHFQWKSECPKGLTNFTPLQKSQVADQLSDVLSYLVRLADECDIDLSDAFLKKMVKNRSKYPKDQVKGSSKKYNLYKQATIESQELNQFRQVPTENSAQN